MKKVLSLILVLALCLSVSACGKKAASKETASTTAATTVPTLAPTTKPATAPSTKPTKNPTTAPTIKPITVPAWSLGSTPTIKPTTAPTKPAEKTTIAPVTMPAEKATIAPVTMPAEKTTIAPVTMPAEKTTIAPVTKPAENSTTAPAAKPAEKPATAPATKPAVAPATKPAEAPHTHTWKDATCQSPKTCSACGATEGSVGTHNFVNGVCTVCNAADVLNPNNNLKIYGDAKEEYVAPVYTLFDEDMITAKGIFFHNDGGDFGCVLLTIYFYANEGNPDPSRTTVMYGGKKYFRTADGYNPASVTLTDSDILVTQDDGSTIKMVLLGNGDLKVTASSNSSYPVDMVLTTAWN